jgi:beta-lactamase class C
MAFTTAGTEDPVTTETVFRWASLSKGVAADMVVLLADRQQLSLFAPSGRYSASLKLPAATRTRRRSRDLLSHRLGLFAHAQDPRLEEGWDPQLSAQLARIAAQYLPARELPRLSERRL